MTNDTPINFDEISDLFALALLHNEDVPDEIVGEIETTVREACANNKSQLMWQNDYDEFVAILDEMLDGIYGNGYDEQIDRLDATRQKLE